PEFIVASYLDHVKVSTKNKRNEDFKISLRVFVDMKQTLLLQSSTPPSPSYNDLRDRFKDLCSRYEELKKSRLPQRSTLNRQIVRLRSPQTPNRFKTVESPVFIKGRCAKPAVEQQIAEVTHQTLKLTLTTPQESTLPQKVVGHHPLPRTRVPKKNRHDRSSSQE
ncbi:hypothetical protein BGZ83_004730, partial [Gryganskiella cystojenkinii]